MTRNLVQKCSFNSHSRKHGETVSQFVVELKRLSILNFGDNLDENFQDQGTTRLVGRKDSWQNLP